MMMRQIATYSIAALTCMAFISTSSAFGAVDENLDLVKLVSEYNDTYMTAYDLAFFLTTHNCNAMPKEGYVLVTINGTTCRAVPNCTIGIVDLTNMELN
jgi:hypothetical protein